MKRIIVLFINIAILTATSLLMRTIGVSYSIYLSNKIGSAGIGLFQLIMSVFFLFITFSTSGIRLATTRLIAEELGVGKKGGAKKAVKNCIFYALTFSSIFSILLFFCADLIGTYWLRDVRTILSLRILAFSLPFIAVSSVLSGYFTAVRRVVNTSSVLIFEQLIKISITVSILIFFAPKGLEYACAAIVIGFSIGEVCSFLLILFLYVKDISRYKHTKPDSQHLVSRMLNIALPVAFADYIRSSIRTTQQLLIPIGLKKSGSSSDMALSTYGTIQGMVMPVLFFPSAFLDAVSDLMIPELAECKACGSKRRINYIVNRVFKFGLLSSLGVMCIFLRFSNELGTNIYHSQDAAYFILILAPMVPIWYMDMVVDSMLKGLGEQVSCMRYNIIESCISVVLIYVLLPLYGINGYIFTIMSTKILNFSLSIYKLSRIIEFKVSIPSLIKPFICILGALNFSELFFRYALNHMTNHLTAQITVVALFYFLLLRLLASITREDIIWAKSLFQRS